MRITSDGFCIWTLCGLLLGFAGCSNHQSGNYSTTGSISAPFRNGIGEIVAMKGFELDRNFEVKGVEKILLAVAVFRSADVGYEGISLNGAGTTSTLSLVLSSGSGFKKNIDIVWNRRSDEVSIGSMHFDRRDGNLVIINLKNQREFAISQVPGVVSSTHLSDFETVLEQHLK